MILMPMNGSSAQVSLPMDTLAIAEATNKHTPTGGVVRPMTRFSTHIRENWIGSMPSATA